MVPRTDRQELIVGAKVDPTFGPVILFGQGGTAVEIVADHAIALPPLNLALARNLVNRTRVARLLDGYRDRPAADRRAIETVLVRISQLMIDLPEAQEIDINPLLADQDGVIALDARIRIARAPQSGVDRLAIRPYPSGLEETVEIDGLRLTLRPIRPEDEAAHDAFVRSLAPEDIRFRFFGSVRELPHSELARYTQIDYDREMAFIASAEDAPGNGKTYGVVRVVADPDNERAEFAIIVRSDMKGHGLGHILLEKIIRYCRASGTRQLVGQVLRENFPMLSLAERLGFIREKNDMPGIVSVLLNLQGNS